METTPNPTTRGSRNSGTPLPPHRGTANHVRSFDIANNQRRSQPLKTMLQRPVAMAGSLRSQAVRTLTATRPAAKTPNVPLPKKQPAAAVVPSVQPTDLKSLKEMLIKERLAEVAENTEAAQENTRQKPAASQSRLTAILLCTLAILLFGGWLTYVNLPNLSLRVAAAQAGIAANFPTYTPEGYRFTGPIMYSPGAVAITFQSNSGQQYTVKQQRSSWDSKALLDNYVANKSDSYLTYQEGGMTVYSYNNSAAWVNGGLLYTVDSSGHLTSDQLLRMAASL